MQGGCQAGRGAEHRVGASECNAKEQAKKETAAGVVKPRKGWRRKAALARKPVGTTCTQRGFRRLSAHNLPSNASMHRLQPARARSLLQPQPAPCTCAQQQPKQGAGHHPPAPPTGTAGGGSLTGAAVASAAFDDLARSFLAVVSLM